MVSLDDIETLVWLRYAFPEAFEPEVETYDPGRRRYADLCEQVLAQFAKRRFMNPKMDEEDCASLMLEIVEVLDSNGYFDDSFGLLRKMSFAGADAFFVECSRIILRLRYEDRPLRRDT